MLIVAPVSIQALPVPELTVPELIRQIDDLSIRNSLWCESSWRQFNKDGSLVKGQAGELGLGQFKQSTWDMFNKQRGTDLDITKAKDQIDMVKWAWRNDYQEHWTCWFKTKDKKVPIYP